MMKCGHKNEEIKEYRRVNAVLLECPDCLHMRMVVVCECCGQGEAVYIHQTEPEHCVEERKEEWEAICEACHIAIKSGGQIRLPSSIPFRKS